MKTAILAFCTSALVLTTPAIAGINGTYKVSGSETADGEKLSFRGTISISNYTAGQYNLKFADGESATYKFKFKTPLKKTSSSQTVNAFNNLGTSVATFTQKDGKFTIKFTYRSKNGSLKGSGSGSK